MNGRKQIERKLAGMAREETPDAWTALRAKALEAMPEPAGTERKAPMMNRRRTWLLAGSGAAAFVAVAAVSIALLLSSAAPLALTPGGTVKVPGGTLVLNGVTASNLKIGMPPDAETVSFKSTEELVPLFGRDPIPTLPKGFVRDAATIDGMLFRTGSVFLMNGIAYSTDPEDPYAPRVYFDLNDQGELPLMDCRFTSESPSLLDGVEVMVGMQTFDEDDGKGPYDVYTATLVANGVGYRIRTVRVSAEDFLAILRATIQG